MNKTDCMNERSSSKTVGSVIIVVSLLLFAVGMVIVPVVGFIFAIPLLILGIGMIAAPQSKACRLILRGLATK